MSKSNGLKLSYALALATQLGFLIVFSIGGFILTGMWLDNKLNTDPWFLIAGIVIGVGTAVSESYQLIEPIIKRDDKENDKEDETQTKIMKKQK